MNFEPKKTDKAAFVALWHNNELLVLQSRKWRDEGTPYLLPGGGFKQNAKSAAHVAAVELFEETGIGVLRADSLKFFGAHKTKWTGAAHLFETDTKTALTVYDHKLQINRLDVEDKICGHEWWNFEKDRARIEALKPFMMPGLKWYLEQKGLL